MSKGKIAASDVLNIPIKNMNLYPCFDIDGYYMGMIATPLGKKDVIELSNKWNKWAGQLIDKDRDPGIGAGSFAKYIRRQGHPAVEVCITANIILDPS